MSQAKVKLQHIYEFPDVSSGTGVKMGTISFASKPTENIYNLHSHSEQKQLTHLEPVDGNAILKKQSKSIKDWNINIKEGLIDDWTADGNADENLDSAKKVMNWNNDNEDETNYGSNQWGQTENKKEEQ